MKKITLLFLIVALCFSCYTSKERIPSYFIKKGKELNIIIIPKNLDEEVYKNNQFIKDDIYTSLNNNNIATLVLRNEYVLNQQELDNWSWMKENKYLNTMERIIKILDDEYFKINKKHIYVVGVYEGKILPYKLVEIPALEFTILYTCELDEILKVIEKYFVIDKLYYKE
ncbi:MAG TPA: hypothetical protein PK771_05795 [Spirochaetota bacterium]|nr:hypothetical protein [Spirochaetota bacterium]